MTYPLHPDGTLDLTAREQSDDYDPALEEQWPRHTAGQRFVYVPPRTRKEQMQNFLALTRRLPRGREFFKCIGESFPKEAVDGE